ncbi:MAG: M23 family metallopeptidase [Gemmatimonadaceae bacterium]
MPRLPFCLILAFAAACEVVPKAGEKQDTSTVIPTVPVDSARIDSVISGVPAVPPDSAAALRTVSDSAALLLLPAQPRRGGVLFVLARGLVAEMPRCSWKGAPLPCYRTDEGIRATVPLPADDPAGVFTLTIDRPGGGARITRQVAVADHDFGREIIFLDQDNYKLVTQTSEIAREARALLQVMSAETPQQRWAGKWRDPVQSSNRGSAYGIERFYYPASDSTRSISLGATLRTRGAFGSDTSTTRASGAPGWRHAGIDIPVKRGTPVRAPAAGVVTEVGAFLLSGQTVVLDHGHGVHTAYFHLDSTSVRKGDAVRAGGLLGLVGASGLATGSHLHYGVYVHGRDVDPAAWIEGLGIRD